MHFIFKQYIYKKFWNTLTPVLDRRKSMDALDVKLGVHVTYLDLFHTPLNWVGICSLMRILKIWIE